MRATITAIGLLCGISIASAQPFYIPEQANEELTRCTNDYNAIFAERPIAANVLVVITPERRRKLMPRKRRLHDDFVKFCDRLKRDLERRPRGPFPPNFVERIAKHRAVVEELKKDPPPSPNAPPAPYQAWSGYYYIPGPSFTVFSDAGWTAWTSNRDFPDFNQTLVRAGNWFVNVGGLYNHPFGPRASHFWLSAGFMMFYLHTQLREVRNLLAPGSLRVSGHDDAFGGAFVAGVGGRLPGDLSRFEWQVLLGIGAASDSVRGSGPAGAELFRSRATVAAWLARAALYYLATENLKLGAVFGVIELERQTGALANLTNFAIGKATNSYAGVSIAYTFGTR